jgi:hypothetical protein
MLTAVRALIATVLAVLATPTAALAQDPVPAPEPIVVQVGNPAPDPTVGPGQVITDPAGATEPPATTDVPVATDGVAQELRTGQPKRGEVHVLGTGATASSAPPAAALPPAQTSRAAAAAPARRVTASRRILPFTGVDAGVLALVGLGLLAAGSGLLAVLRQPVQ